MRLQGLHVKQKCFKGMTSPDFVVAVASCAPQAPNRAHFQPKTALCDANRTNFSNNCSRFIAPAADLRCQNRLAPAPYSSFPFPEPLVPDSCSRFFNPPRCQARSGNSLSQVIHANMLLPKPAHAWYFCQTAMLIATMDRRRTREGGPQLQAAALDHCSSCCPPKPRTRVGDSRKESLRPMKIARSPWEGEALDVRKRTLIRSKSEDFEIEKIARLPVQNRELLVVILLFSCTYETWPLFSDTYRTRRG
jgi:hypothetical protein